MQKYYFGEFNKSRVYFGQHQAVQFANFINHEMSGHDLWYASEKPDCVKIGLIAFVI